MSQASYSFSDFYNLQSKQQENPEQLWKEQKKYQRPKKVKQFQQTVTTPQPNLLRTAVAYMNIQKKMNQQQAMSDLQSMYSSNFVLSRQNTPVNYVFNKKHKKHKTVSSELFDIESQAQKNDQVDIFDQIVLEPHYIGLSDLVQSQIIGRQKKVNPMLVHAWKDCLMHEDKTQIYGPNAEYSFSRIFPVNQLQKGFSQIYGSGKRRCLRKGQESALLYEIQKYLQKCHLEYNKIARKPSDIINEVLSKCKMDFQHFPNCWKQAELFWKIMATFWRYSGKLDFTNNKLEGFLVSGSNNFIDLSKESPVTEFLLQKSNFKDLINR